MSDVTVVLTSCGRIDLLERTLESFNHYNKYPIKEILLIDDSASIDTFKKIRNTCRTLRPLFNFDKAGQIKSIDRAYQFVETPYIFHMEDDWEFIKGGFIEKSKIILEREPDTIQVHLRHFADLNGHPIVETSSRLVEEFPHIVACDLEVGYQGIWGGFSFNPGLRRLKDYNDLGKLYQDIGHESDISKEYIKRGKKACVIIDRKGYVKHIGNGRHIKDPTHPYGY